MRRITKFFPLPHTVLEDMKFIKLSPIAKIVYMYLAKHENFFRNPDGWFFRSIETLCKDIGISKRSLLRAIKELQEAGFIEVKRGKNTDKNHRSPNFYRVNGFHYEAVS